MRVGFLLKNVASFRQSPLQSSEVVVKSGAAGPKPPAAFLTIFACDLAIGRGLPQRFLESLAVVASGWLTKGEAILRDCEEA